MPVHRVSLRGSLSEEAKTSLQARGVFWLTSREAPGEQSRHFVLVDAANAGRATTAVRDALALDAIAVDPETKVYDDFGVGRRPFVPPGTGPDWDEVRTRIQLTAEQENLLDSLLDNVEPTWQLIGATGEPTERNEATAALANLERLGLVRKTRQWSGKSADMADLDDWWEITDHGWDLLGLIPSPCYGRT